MYQERRNRSTTVRLTAGLPYPLGATWDGRGTNFALFSAPIIADYDRWEMPLDTTHPSGAPSHAAYRFTHAPARSVLVFAASP